MQNYDYVAQRDALIPRAVAHANKTVGANPQSSAGRYAWNRAYHSKMNDLARKLDPRELHKNSCGVRSGRNQ